MRRFAASLVLFLLAAMAGTGQTPAPTLYQKPTVNATHIVFSYAGDLWSVPRGGGDARQLTTGTGAESDPRFSPDGAMIAFTGEYDGNVDVFVIPAEGGIPRRLTYHPGNDTVVGWTPDSKSVLFRSTRSSFTFGVNGLFTIPGSGGVALEVPLPAAFEGSYSPDGKRLAYQPLSQWQPEWKRYRGGQTARIWLADLADSSVTAIPRENSNDFSPMWVGDTVYFLSDRDGATTLYAYSVANRRVTRVLPNEKLDIKSASAGGDAIVYERFGTIHLYDLKARRSQPVSIRVAGDFASVRPRFERAAARATNAQISPAGARAVFEVRGEIVTVPAEKGDPRNLTNTPGVMERFPAWSPDGKWVAYFSDESGEYALHLRAQTGAGEVRKISLGNPSSFFYSPVWSPDSKKIAYTDKRGSLWYLEIDKGEPVRIDSHHYVLFAPQMNPAWSPDSRWVAYTRILSNRLSAVFVYSLESAKSTPITDGMSDAQFAVFDKKGEHLYFLASTDAGPALTGGDMSQIAYRTTSSVYLTVLRSDRPSPLAPESDEEKVTEEKKEEAKPAGPPSAASKEPEPVRIDFDGITQRTIALSIPARAFTTLQAGKTGFIYLLESVPPPANAPPGQPFGQTLYKYDLAKRSLDRVLEGVTNLRISHNGEKMLLRRGPQWLITSATQPPRPGEGALPMGGIEVYVDPRAEWTQMYREAWRHQRDFFYDPGFHGLDLQAAAKQYEPYLAAVAHRADLNYLFAEMLNQLTVGHMFIAGGDIPRPGRVSGGLLGADYTIENGRYRFARIYNGESWNPQLRAPLTQPGVNVRVGEYLLAVNGREVTGGDNLYSFFESTAGKSVLLKVGPDAGGANSREVTVTPVASEAALRNLAWIEGNRRKVTELSGGRLAYIYLPDTAGGGFANFNRYFFAQTDKQGALIDERFNGGGLLADYVVGYLSRTMFNMIAQREGADVPTPAGAIYGPKAMLINESAGSGGDAMPWYFRKAKVGPLIGKRTWGGLVGAAGTPPLMDGGFVASPASALYGLQGEWEVENVGVPPDIEVEMDPKAWRAGRDTQLERAVQYLLDELKKNPPVRPKRPPYPNYHRGKAGGGPGSPN